MKCVDEETQTSGSVVVGGPSLSQRERDAAAVLVSLEQLGQFLEATPWDVLNEIVLDFNLEDRLLVAQLRAKLVQLQEQLPI